MEHTNALFWVEASVSFSEVPRQTNFEKKAGPTEAFVLFIQTSLSTETVLSIQKV